MADLSDDDLDTIRFEASARQRGATNVIRSIMRAAIAADRALNAPVQAEPVATDDSVYRQYQRQRLAEDMVNMYGAAPPQQAAPVAPAQCQYPRCQAGTDPACKGPCAASPHPAPEPTKLPASFSACSDLLRLSGKPYPRTCKVCGLGPCKDAARQAAKCEGE